MNKDEFKCLDCLKTYDKSLQSTHYPASCIYCLDNRQEYREDAQRDKDEVFIPGGRDE